MSWGAHVTDLPRWAPPAPSGRAGVVVAHPDDETLALTAVVRALVVAGWSVSLTCLTRGEGAFGELPDDVAHRLVARRGEELSGAWSVLAPQSPLRVLDLPDSALDADPERVADAVQRACADADLLVGLWDGDPHPDHAAVGRSLLAAASGRRPVVLAPLWARVWFTPAHPQIPWSRCRRVPADEGVRTLRRRALDEHRSQLVGFEGRTPVVTDVDRAEFLADDVLVVTGPEVTP